MDLTVVIVNYNVKFFLEQCLHSVLKASKNLQVEVIVVDNNSTDGSVPFITEKFKSIQVIANKENTGFSKANNQAINVAKGRYILLLNPDTIVEEKTFTEVVRFMDKTPDAGGLGVKMIDGKGNFLPESKRGLPTPTTAFYKIFGLSALFPYSKKFNKYYLGYLPNDEIHAVDVLSGAFMLLRKTVIDRIGMLDESFFMYGEDIDLSYRITQSGYKNYYFPNTTIIHYKGESTKKQSINYVIVFYKAMLIFAKKHFSRGLGSRLLLFCISIAVYFRAFIAIVNRYITKQFFVLADVIFLSIALFSFKYLYQQYTGIHYENMSNKVLVLYIAIWILTNIFSGAYIKPIRLEKSMYSTLLGSAIILVMYSLFPEDYRFSRAILLFGIFSFALFMYVSRKLANTLPIPDFKLYKKHHRRILVVADTHEADKIHQNLLSTFFNKPEFIGLVSVKKDIPIDNSDFICDIYKLSEAVESFNINEVIYSSKDISSTKIMELMVSIQKPELEQKIAHIDKNYIIGSNSITTTNSLFFNNVKSIESTFFLQKKRINDVALSIIILLFFPLFGWFIKDKIYWLVSAYDVLWGKKTWVGIPKNELISMPTYVFSWIQKISGNNTNEQEIQQMLEYIKNYHFWLDARYIFQKLF